MSESAIQAASRGCSRKACLRQMPGSIVTTIATIHMIKPYTRNPKAKKGLQPAAAAVAVAAAEAAIFKQVE